MPRLTALLLTLSIALTASSPSSADTPVDPAPKWSWPTAQPHPLLRPFIAPATEYGAGHRGVDIGTPDGRLLAPAKGRVHFSGSVAGRGVLSIDHGGGYLSSFEPVKSELKKGDVVAKGDEIAVIDPGHCTVPCVHFGVRLRGDYVSPLLLIGEVPRAVLLPTRAA